MPSVVDRTKNQGQWRTLIGLLGWLIVTGLVSSLLLLLNAALVYSFYRGLHRSIPVLDLVPVWQFIVYAGSAILLFLEWTLFDSLLDPIRRRFKSVG